MRTQFRKLQGEEMKKLCVVLSAIFFAFAIRAQCQEGTPLKLVETYKLSSDVKGNFDHFAIDLAGNRLFATPEEYKAVLVFDIKTGKLIHKIAGIEKPTRGSVSRRLETAVHN
jgi:hypothetical protein